jgi:hypothetical protein
MIVRQLGLVSRAVTGIHTPSTRGTPSLHHLYDIKLTLSHPQMSFSIDCLPVIESDLLIHGIQALIGRDVLAHCLFVFDGKARTFALSF